MAVWREAIFNLTKFRIFSFLNIETRGIIKYTLVLNTKIVEIKMFTFFLSLGTRDANRIIATEKVDMKTKVVRVFP